MIQIKSVAVLFILTTLSLEAQDPTPTPSTGPSEVPSGFEALPTLNASQILQPQFLAGANFTVQNDVPTYSGSNRYTINSDYGVFLAGSNVMLMRRLAEINGIASLKALQQTDQFVQAAAQAATVPIHVAKDLVTQPVETISSIPRGVWGFLNQAGEAVKEAAQGVQSGEGQGNLIQNASGFSAVKRGIALRLGVDPYCQNAFFQQELNKVAWPVFLGKFAVSAGFAAISGGVGTALSAANITNTLQESLRDKSPTDLRLMNEKMLMQDMGISQGAADAFLNNTAISPMTQTVIVSALAQLGNIPGQGEFIKRAAASEGELQALGFQQSVQMMANLDATSPVATISQLEGLTVCQTNDGTIVVPVQWDYLAWTPDTANFINALKTQKFPSPATGFTIMINGTASPLATQSLADLKVNLVTLALPGPLQP